MGRLNLSFFLVLLATAPVHALEINIDSDLADWLAAAPSGNSADDWTPKSGEGIKWMLEDQTGTSGYLDPGWGGQTYDAEAIYVQRSDTHINVAIVTGRAPDASGYRAGDIAIDFGLDGSFDIGVLVLDSSVGSSGQVFDVTSWDYGLWAAPGVAGDPDTAYGQAHPTAVASGTARNGGATVPLSYAAFAFEGVTGLGLGEYGDAGKHYVIETAIPLDLLDPTHRDAAGFLVHWTMACANDFVAVDPPGAAPVPAPLALLALGSLGLLVRRPRVSNAPG